MIKESLDEREFELVNIIGPDLAATQRDISRHLDLSLGTVNILIRRLIAKGYIRMKHLDKRRVEYILTPKGFAEKMRQSVKYTLKTINSITLIKNRVKEVVNELYGAGHRRFFILGHSDFGVLVEMVLHEAKWQDSSVGYIAEIPNYETDGVILICRENIQPNEQNQARCVDLVHDLAKNVSLLTKIEGN